MRYKLSFLLLVAVWTNAAWAAPVEMELKDLNGKVQRLSGYRGKWVVVNYWATWCPPCRAEIPELVFFHDAHKGKDALVLGVNSEDATPRQVLDFLDEYMVSYPILLSSPDDGSPLGNIRGLPTTFLISPKGEVVYTHTGMVTKQSLENTLLKFRSPSNAPTKTDAHETHP
ncbi:MAG: TlpA disulfide reductase family protein [Pseudomonadota bacterium]